MTQLDSEHRFHSFQLRWARLNYVHSFLELLRISNLIFAIVANLIVWKLASFMIARNFDSHQY